MLKTLIIFGVLAVNILFGIRDSVQQSDSPENMTMAEVAEPEVYLQGYRHSSTWAVTSADTPAEDYKDFVVKEDDGFSVINPDLHIILLTCRAAYPLYWVMTDVQPRSLELQTNTRVTFGENLTNPEAVEFLSDLLLLNHPSLTGLYTCRSLDSSPVLQKNVHVFLPGIGDHSKLLSNDGEEFTVGLNDKESVILPCKGTKRDVDATLSIKQNIEEEWTPLNATFDPKKGFALNKDDFTQIPAIYKCAVHNSTEEVIVNLVNETLEVEPVFPLKTLTEGSAAFKLRKTMDGVECCSNSTSSPELSAALCHNQPECEMRKRGFLHREKHADIQKSILDTCCKRSLKPCRHTAAYTIATPLLVQCVGDGIDVSAELMTVFDTLAPESQRFRYVSVAGNEEYSVDKFVKLVVKKLVNQTIGPVSQLGPISQLVLKPIDPLRELYDGDDIVFECCGFPYHHAYGRFQRLGWNDGSIETISSKTDEPWSPQASDFCNTYLLDPDDDVTMPANVNMSYIECIIPLWTNVKPSIKRLDLNIRVPKPPVLVSEEAVSVVYDYNQLGMLSLVCNLSQGDPMTKMMWKKDGYDINRTDLYWSMVHDPTPENPSTVLLFMRAVKEIEGEYECSAENFLGNVTKAFTVKVNPRSYLEYWIAVGGFGGFFALMCCCALRISASEKRTPAKAQVEPTRFT